MAQFRADYARYPGDASFNEVIADLRQASPKFKLWWEQQDVRGLPEGPRAMQHPTLGALEFEHASFQTSFSTDMHRESVCGVARDGRAAGAGVGSLA